jgi:hypothetical protein
LRLSPVFVPRIHFFVVSTNWWMRPSTDCPICSAHNGNDQQGEIWSSGVRMESYQWFLLGIMVALTPSLLVLGLLLVRSHDQAADTNHSGE